MNISELFKGRFVFKIVALFLAVVTYIYVWGEISNRGMSPEKREFLKKVSSKVVPVKVELKGEPPGGYQILKTNIRVKPEKIILLGIKEDLENISEITTELIDVRKFTHTQVLYVSVVPIRNAINVSSKMVEVEIPVITNK